MAMVEVMASAKPMYLNPSQHHPVDTYILLYSSQRSN
jgi:hypothetical protein